MLTIACEIVGGGSFFMGSTDEDVYAAGEQIVEQYTNTGLTPEQLEFCRRWPENELPRTRLAVASLRVGRYPVTNGQWQLFLDAGGMKADQPWWNPAGRQWLLRQDAVTDDLTIWQQRANKNHPRYWDDDQFGSQHSQRPVVGISWYEAGAFCRWLSLRAGLDPDGPLAYRLPTEAEWEWIARGPDQLTYVWGSAFAEHRANCHRLYGRTTDVGMFPAGASRDGIHDLSGNVWEWCSSKFASYPYVSTDGREDQVSSGKELRVVRGGAWYLPPIRLRCANRSFLAPDYSYNSLGFRIVQSIE